MKNSLIIVLAAIISIGCNAQKEECVNKIKEAVVQPKGTWKVDKEFDEYGNLIKYDSIYSYSSNNTLENLSPKDRDSLMQSFKSKFFANFSGFIDQGFEHLFSRDSIFSNHFFNDDFYDSNFSGDLINIEKMRKQMIERQLKFLEKYNQDVTKPKENITVLFEKF